MTPTPRSSASSYAFAGAATPPEAYTGGNDWYHLHTHICVGFDLQKIGRTEGETEREECEAAGGTYQPIFFGHPPAQARADCGCCTCGSSRPTSTGPTCSSAAIPAWDPTGCPAERPVLAERTP